MFLKQVLAIQAKNWTVNARTKEYIRENVSVIILSIFIVISERMEPNSFQTPFYLGIAVTSYSRAVAVLWLDEKESHQQELQRIMGVSYLSYLCSWLLYFILNGAIISGVMLVIMRFLVLTDNTQFALGYGFIDLVPLYFLYVLSNIGYILFLCCFFSKAKNGSQAITFIQLVTNFLYFLRFSEDAATNSLVVNGLSIFPQMSFNMCLSNIAFLNPDFPGVFDISYTQANLTLLGTFFGFTLLALYLNQIIPNEMGTQRHPFFFLGCDKKTRPDELHQQLLEGNENMRKESSAKYEEIIERKSAPLIRIKQASKWFGKKMVIDDLSVDFYGGEIFCLLGHNGAGKSTTINLLTGLLTATSGYIDILGLSYPADMDQIRRDIGLCLQYNVLYDELTVEEHLLYYYRIKNLDQEGEQEAINSTIVQCALDNERGKISKNLSGGNKRKLCLANSLIGGARIIFLDEPSSGLDPNSRQSIWAILKNISSEDRCIILTTHHLEEAEELSSRIAIMSHGKFTILGSPHFITEHYSVGYHAVVTLNKTKPKAEAICREILTTHIAHCKEDKQTAKNTLKFVLPLEELPNYSKAFKALEDAQIGQLSVLVSNLEDAFVKIGEEEDNLTEGFQQLNASSENEEEVELRKEEKKEKKKTLILPEVSCQYSFRSQFQGVLVRKARTVLRSMSSVISIAMPTAFMIIGVVVVCLVIPDPSDKDSSDDRDRRNSIKLFTMSYFMVWAFIFNTASYCGSIVLEREKRFKYLSNVSGLRRLPYWTANYTFDLLIFLVPLVAFFIVLYAIGEKGEFMTQFSGMLTGLLLLFGLSFIGYSYLFSFVFQKSSTAFRFFPFMNLIFFYFVPLIPFILSPEGLFAQYVMPLISPFVALAMFFNTREVLDVQADSSSEYIQLSVPYLCLAIQAIFYIAAVLFLENMRFSLEVKANEHIEDDRHDNQVFEERPDRNSLVNAPIKIEHLTKVYGNGKTAIRNNSFSVGEGEIFGLLGPNGAGKSTSFNIITAAVPKSTGSVKLFGEEVNKGIMQIFEQVGVCPQYNPLYEKLTLKEHLQYFAMVKGIPANLIDSTIDFYSELLSLQEYMDVHAGVLSGGNKRKMCVAMTMIGNPNVAFFDEPSAGVDPISRRFLWKCLTAATNSKKTAMVLTTHSMNEAENLCSRIGILINGQFVCLDTPKSLKEEYGKGYRVNVTVDPQQQEEIIEAVKRQFEGVEIEHIENDARLLVFIIKADNFCLSLAFDLFENQLRLEGKIDKYQIKESTLEEVFIHLSRLQPHVQEQQFNEPWQLLCWEWGNNGCNLAI